LSLLHFCLGDRGGTVSNDWPSPEDIGVRKHLLRWNDKCQSTQDLR